MTKKKCLTYITICYVSIASFIVEINDAHAENTRYSYNYCNNVALILYPPSRLPNKDFQDISIYIVNNGKKALEFDVIHASFYTWPRVLFAAYTLTKKKGVWTIEPKTGYGEPIRVKDTNNGSYADFRDRHVVVNLEHNGRMVTGPCEGDIPNTKYADISNTEYAYEPALVRQVQTNLKERGYSPGTLDGLWGNNTKKALRAFQRDNKLQVTGELDDETKAVLIGGDN